LLYLVGERKVPRRPCLTLALQCISVRLRSVSTTDLLAHPSVQPCSPDLSQRASSAASVTSGGWVGGGGGGGRGASRGEGSRPVTRPIPAGAKGSVLLYRSVQLPLSVLQFCRTCRPNTMRNTRTYFWHQVSATATPESARSQASNTIVTTDFIVNSQLCSVESGSVKLELYWGLFFPWSRLEPSIVSHLCFQRYARTHLTTTRSTGWIV
jgi:hypothetical protein